VAKRVYSHCTTVQAKEQNIHACMRILPEAKNCKLRLHPDQKARWFAHDAKCARHTRIFEQSYNVFFYIQNIPSYNDSGEAYTSELMTVSSAIVATPVTVSAPP